MEFARYQTASLMQNDVVLQAVNITLGGLVDTTWWTSLRLGNWKLFEEALSNHIEADGVEYEILSGVSGIASAPIYRRNCDSNRSFVEIVDRGNRKIPLYIWNYLKASHHNSEDLVIIGINSPFYEVW